MTVGTKGINPSLASICKTKTVRLPFTTDQISLSIETSTEFDNSSYKYQAINNSHESTIRI